MVSIGSPGTSRIRKNATSVMPMKVGMMRLTRVRMKRSMVRDYPKTKRGGALSRPLPRLLVDVDPVEIMPAEGRELEIDDFPAHRLQLHGMRDGEPGRLFLEDDLRLFVELAALGLVVDRLGLD